MIKVLQERTFKRIGKDIVIDEYGNKFKIIEPNDRLFKETVGGSKDKYLLQSLISGSRSWVLAF